MEKQNINHSIEKRKQIKQYNIINTIDQNNNPNKNNIINPIQYNKIKNIIISYSYNANIMPYRDNSIGMEQYSIINELQSKSKVKVR